MFFDYPQTLKQALADLIFQVYAVKIEPVLTRPKNMEHGDWASPVALSLQSRLNDKTSPLLVAEELAKVWKQNAETTALAQVETAAPGFLNFRLPDAELVAQTQQIIQQENYGVKAPKAETILVEFSSPNIAKQMHVGNLRSTIIGPALANLYQTQGYQVIRASHPGDWGKQFGILIDQYVLTYGQDLTAAKNLTLPELENLYVTWNQENKENPERQKSARNWLVQLQSGDNFATELWIKFSALSQIEVQKIYDRLGVYFSPDAVKGESFYHERLAGLILLAEKHGAVPGEVSLDGGRPIILPLDEYGIKTPVMLRKGDGAYLYHTTDLAAIEYRKAKYDQPAGTLAGVKYVVANEQTLHFQQLFAAAQKIGLLTSEEASRWEHIKFGFVLGEQGNKFSTRDGNAIKLQALLDRAVAYAKELTKEKNADLPDEELDEIAEIIGIGSLIFSDLQQNRQSDIIFDWDKILDFSGHSAVYILYTLARLKSLKQKVQAQYPDLSQSFEMSATEVNLLGLPENAALRSLAVTLHYWPMILTQAANESAPHILAQYLLDLAGQATKAYHEKQLVGLDSAEAKFSLNFFEATIKLLESGLKLLGLKTVKRL